PGDHFFAGARFAEDQHLGLGARGARDLLAQRMNGAALAHELELGCRSFSHVLFTRHVYACPPMNSTRLFSTRCTTAELDPARSGKFQFINSLSVLRKSGENCKGKVQCLTMSRGPTDIDVGGSPAGRRG